MDDDTNPDAAAAAVGTTAPAVATTPTASTPTGSTGSTPTAVSTNPGTRATTTPATTTPATTTPTTAAAAGADAPRLGEAHTPLRQAVVEAIRDRIVDGRYAPGSRLYEESVAAELGVSRNPIREAFQTLASDGFVVIEPRRGARVASIDAKRATEIFEVRQSLEGLVAALAAERATDDQITELAAIVDEGDDAVRRNALADLPHLNTRFHRQLCAMAGNDLLTDTLDQLSGIIRWIYAERLEDRVRNSWHEHRLLLAAITDRDVEGARAGAADHVSSAYRAYSSTRESDRNDDHRDAGAAAS